MTIKTLTLAAVLLSTIGAGPSNRTYTVRQGDTLSKISKQVGVKPAELAKANRLTNVHKLAIGQVLVVPGFPAKPQAATTTLIQVGVQSAELYSSSIEASKSIRELEQGANGTLLRETDGWSQIRLADGEVGWMRSSALTVGMPSFIVSPAKIAVTPVAKKTVSASSLMTKAYSYRGVRYRFGGTSRSGVDCSGFTSIVFRSQGIELPRTAAQQSRAGKGVSRAQLQKGDLVFFSTRGRRIGHVGIYVGENQFIHAATSAGRVRIDSLDHSYYNRRFRAARRVL